ncbi:MAG: hypothetical protein MUF87_05230 [Anaerolineae bacterium]|jgi:hypothetical protein|nr:hypothetical protein [Anaerolineae bacterium]
MGDLLPVLISACGLAIVCVGMLVVGGFILFRFSRNTILGPMLSPLMTLLGRGGNDDEDRDEASYGPATAHRRSVPTAAELRAQAAQLDFEQSVQRYRNQGGVDVPPDPNETPVPFPSVSDFNRDHTPPTSIDRRRRDQQQRREEDEDDLIGGILGAQDDLLP